MGIDLFLEKPSSSKEIAFFVDCIESLLDREQEGGFRGVQSKSLVDIIQLECLSQSSSVLKISQGKFEGKIWIQNGEIVNAECDGKVGVEAFQQILAWKAGNFEMLPADAGRARTIFTSYQGLLLETAQVLDEAQQGGGLQASPGASKEARSDGSAGLMALSRFHGVDFVLSVSAKDEAQFESWGLDNAEQMAAWTNSTMREFQTLGDTLQAGMLNRIDARGPMQNVSAAARGENELCVGFYRSLPAEAVRATMQKILNKWAS